MKTGLFCLILLFFSSILYADTLVITIDDTSSDRIYDAIAKQYNYQAEISDGDGGMIANPETKKEFSQIQLVSFIKTIVRDCEVKDAMVTKRQEIESDIEQSILIS